VSETDTLSLAELEAYGRVWGEGRERRALCPFCGHEHKPDKEHASLAFNAASGRWVCHRCERRGLLTEYKDAEPWPPGGRPRRRARAKPLSEPRPPSPAELAEEAGKRETLRRLWAPSVPLDEPAGEPGARYLEGRAIPREVAVAARLRYAADWYGRPAVVFPVQDDTGRLVAAEGRYIDGGTQPKSRSAGPKSRGVFVATPGALEADGVTVTEGPITALAVACTAYPSIALCGHASAPAWLVRRLALRVVLLAFDEGEQGAEAGAARLARELAGVGARPYRLRLPAEHGDWADYLLTAGRDAVGAELTAALLATWMPTRA